MPKKLIPLICCLFAFSSFANGDEDGMHLFILSGQSNMDYMRPKESFIPTVERTLGKENVIVIKDAVSGQPIKRWYKEWKDASGKPAENAGDLYDQMMSKVKPAIKEKKLASVTFCWMQGERDARLGFGDVYKKSLKELLNQIRKDIPEPELNFVIGRLSDFDLKNERYPHWTMVRKAHVEIADESPRGVWIDTDDLNDGKNRRGKPIKNDLHYSGEGYKLLGQRMADKALELIKKPTPELKK